MMCMLILGLRPACSSCSCSIGSMALQRMQLPPWDKLRLASASPPSRPALCCHLKPSSVNVVVLGLEGGRHWVLQVMAGISDRVMPGEGVSDPPVTGGRGRGYCAVWSPLPRTACAGLVGRGEADLRLARALHNTS